MLSNQVKESFFKIQASKMQTAQLQAQALHSPIKVENLECLSCLVSVIKISFA
ncbi:hypothetical protein [Helicobacter bilis]|nr:hypothetical protein [Helicobacter bilis]